MLRYTFLLLSQRNIFRVIRKSGVLYVPFRGISVALLRNGEGEIGSDIFVLHYFSRTCYDNLHILEHKHNRQHCYVM